MRPTGQSTHSKRGVTLLEMTVVILVMLGLAQIGFFASRKMNEWKLGRGASETLRDVYSAQKMFLADNPVTRVEDITAEDVLRYMRGAPDALPVVNSLTGDPLVIRVNVSPPIFTTSSGAEYDPSDNPRDSLWDVGQ